MQRRRACELFAARDLQGVRRFAGKHIARAFKRVGLIESEHGSGLVVPGPSCKYEIRDRADYYQRDRREAAREVELDDKAPIPAITRSALSRVILDQEARRLEDALDALTPAHRDVILLRKFEELSFAEIGERLGKSEDACRMLLARAMTALTMKLSETPR